MLAKVTGTKLPAIVTGVVRYINDRKISADGTEARNFCRAVEEGLLSLKERHYRTCHRGFHSTRRDPLFPLSRPVQASF